MKETSDEALAHDGRRHGRGAPKKKYHTNWRLEMMAIPKNRKEELLMFSMSEVERKSYLQQKNEKEQKKESKLELARKCREEQSKRLNELCLSPLRYYQSQMQSLKKPSKDNKLLKNLNNLLQQSLESRYHEYDLARANNLKKTKQKKVKKKEEKKTSKSAKKHQVLQKDTKPKLSIRMVELARPRGPPKETIPNRGPLAKLSKIQLRLSELAASHHFTPKYYVEPNAWRKHIVPLSALRYKATPRIVELARPALRRTSEAWIPGSVKPSALTAKPTERIIELSIPVKRKTMSVEPLDIRTPSRMLPRILNYEATPRILELAKPRRIL